MAPRNNNKKKNKDKKKKTKSNQTDVTNHNSNNNSNNNTTISLSLIEQGQNAIQSMELELAEECFMKALSIENTNTNIMDALADIQLQLGETEKAKDLFLQSTLISPLANPYKWLFLGQLQSGNEAVDSYRRGIAILNTILLNTVDNEEKNLLSKQISKAHCSIAEIFMTDLCFEENAESTCEAEVLTSLQIAPDSLDGLQTLASLRLSQNRKAEATTIILQVYDKITHIRSIVRSRTVIEEISGSSEPLEFQDAPELDFCIATVKLLIECGDQVQYQQDNDGCICDKAIDLASELIQEDDENIELWYLVGVAALSILPIPDYEQAIFHLEQAKKMIEKLIEDDVLNKSLYEEQYDLILDHLRIASATEACNANTTTLDKMALADEEWSSEDEEEEVLECIEDNNI